MSRVDELIRALAPAGVPFRRLGDLGRRNSGTSITAAKMKTIRKEGGSVRVFAGGQTLADVDEESVPAKDIVRDPSIIVKSRGNIGFTYYDRPFTHKAELWSYTLTNADIDQKFVYYYLLTKVDLLQETARATSVKLPQLGVRDTDSLRIPVPPLEVQQEIVRILDNFTELEEELEAALEAEFKARRRQYAFYRDHLLSFREAGGVRWIPMGEVLRIRNGKDFKHLPAGNVPVYGSGGVMTQVGEAAFTGESVLIPRKGSIGNLFYVNGPFWTVDTIFWTEADLSLIRPRFLFHYLRTQDLTRLNNAGGVPSLTQALLNPIPIPVPTMAVQDGIVEVLDRFDTLIHDLGIALSAEIAARRKQYEYYRDKLLTFEEAPA